MGSRLEPSRGTVAVSPGPRPSRFCLTSRYTPIIWGTGRVLSGICHLAFQFDSFAAGPLADERHRRNPAARRSRLAPACRLPLRILAGAAVLCPGHRLLGLAGLALP